MIQIKDKKDRCGCGACMNMCRIGIYAFVNRMITRIKNFR